jgi:sigma-B regulation protein RsbU (phosphoserine phosphatase)
LRQSAPVAPERFSRTDRNQTLRCRVEMPTTVAPAAISAAQMSLVLDVSRALAVTADLDTLMHKIAGAVTGLLSCDRASIFLHDRQTDELWTKVALGTDSVIRLPAGAGIVGAAFRAAEAVHVPHPYDDPRFNRDVDRKTGFTTCNLLAVPMFDLTGHPVGVIQAINKSGEGCENGFTDGDVAMLQLLGDQAGVAMQRYHLQQAAVRSMALEREMQLARSVQQAMTPEPDAVPVLPGLEAAGWTKPASINGGDCFDLWKLPDGRLGVLLADASGHGIGPALVVAQVRTLVRTLSETEGDPFVLLQRINARLYDDLPNGRFVTTFLAFVSADGRISFCSAGHGPVLIRPQAGEPLREIEATAPPLGVLPELPADECHASSHIDASGWLIVASDGFTEALSVEDQTLFGTERLIETLDAAHLDHAADVITVMRKAVHDWQGSDDPIDDQTVVAVRRTAGDVQNTPRRDAPVARETP